VELVEEFDHESGEEDQSSSRTKLRNQFSQGVELQLQGNALGIARKG
jgi:hypothetical protein